MDQTFYGLLFCYLTITDVHVTLYLQIIDFQFPSCCTSQPPKNFTKSLLWTVLRILLDPITKKITLARFACLCLLKPFLSNTFTMHAAFLKVSSQLIVLNFPLNVHCFLYHMWWVRQTTEFKGPVTCKCYACTIIINDVTSDILPVLTMYPLVCLFSILSQVWQWKA